MACKINPDCERRRMGELELLRATIDTVETMARHVPRDTPMLLGSTQVCAACALRQIASWLDELHHIKRTEDDLR